jgi:hypothetical protein
LSQAILEQVAEILCRRRRGNLCILDGDRLSRASPTRSAAKSRGRRPDHTAWHSARNTTLDADAVDGDTFREGASWSDRDQRTGVACDLPWRFGAR